MGWKLYLDDVRYPSSLQGWNIARDNEEAKHLVEEIGCPDFISFDYHLDEGDTVYGFVSWFVEGVKEGKIKLPDNFDYTVHSNDANGVRRIENMMEEIS